MVKHLVLVAGNIGTGKTSLTERIGARLGWQTAFESVVDNSYLTEFYGDMLRWSFHLQVFFLGHRVRQHRELASALRSAIADRSIYEDAHIFTRVASLPRSRCAGRFDGPGASWAGRCGWCALEVRAALWVPAGSVAAVEFQENARSTDRRYRHRLGVPGERADGELGNTVGLGILPDGLFRKHGAVGLNALQGKGAFPR